MVRLALSITKAAFSGEKLGLTKEEVAFYDALTKPEAALKTVISQCEMWTDNMDFEDVGEKCADNQVYFAPGEDVREYRIAAENQSNAYRVE